MIGESDKNNVSGVFGGVEFNNNTNGVATTNMEASTNIGVTNAENNTVFKKVEVENLPAKQSVWTKIKQVLFKEIDLNAPIKVELTPYQQKVEDEINEFLHQEVSFKGFFNLFKRKKTEE